MERLHDALRRANDLSLEKRVGLWLQLPPEERCGLAFRWDWQALDRQLEPEGDWRVWLMLAGRGFGKTRAGAEWVLEQVRRTPGARIALVGGNLDEAARVMVEGESGLLACAPPNDLPDWKPGKHELRFSNGAVAQLFSGADGNRLRGPQHHFAWADELGKWSDAKPTWDNLMMGLRLGDCPRVVVTTTPGNTELLGEIQKLSGTRTTGGRTRENYHLPSAFLETMEEAYAGTRLARQELDGEVLGEAEGALWRRATLEDCRVGALSQESITRVVIGVDPPAGDRGDACGIVVCARLADQTAAVLADCSVEREGPEGWARRVGEAAAGWGADRVIAEANNGGAMVEQVLRAADCGLPVRRAWASRGKAARAEPIATLFEAGRVKLAGMFPKLEDELTQLTVGGYQGHGSPDRADAMVWALSELMLQGAGAPRVRRL
nr:terminase family protein [Sphingomonas arenae]